MKTSLKSGTSVGYTVNVREYGGAYIARCEGRKASCTRTPEEAARKAAAKAFNRSGLFKRKVHDDDVQLTEIVRGLCFTAAASEGGAS